MSEGDVSLIRDEDVLRRMWQQTEDFSRKKEIRAHMYRLREERLRNLYSPEPTARADGKGCEFTSAQGHVKSFADQTFQSMKSKEVRDAGSPPKEFTYRGQDLKELSNAGWNVESENRTTDDGHTNVRTVQANIEGKYDVEGGRGQFAAIDRQKQAVTEYHDDNTSLKRNESSSNTAAHEQVVRQTDDGTRISSTTSSSTSSSKFQQVSSTKHESVPYLTNDDYDLSRQTLYDTNRNEEVKRQVTKTSDYEQNLRRSDFDKAELVSRKVEYPDDNTKVVVETRCLPDGTRVTSTRREFRAPATQTSHSEHHSYQTQSRNDNKSYYTSSHQQSDVREFSKLTRKSTDDRTTNIVDSQRNVDDYDFKRNHQIDYSTNKNDDYSQTRRNVTQQHYDTRTNQTGRTVDDVDSRQYTKVEHLTSEKDDYNQIKKRTNHIVSDTKIDDTNVRETVSSHDIRSIKSNVQDVRRVRDNEDHIRDITVTSHDNKNSKHDVHDIRQVRDDDERVHKVNISSYTDQNIKRDTQDFRQTRDNEERIHKITVTSQDDQHIKRDSQDVRRTRDDQERIHKITVTSQNDQHTQDHCQVRDDVERTHKITVTSHDTNRDTKDIRRVTDDQQRIHKTVSPQDDHYTNRDTKVIRRVEDDEQRIYKTVSSQDDHYTNRDTKDIRRVTDDVQRIHKTVSSHDDQYMKRDTQDRRQVRDDEERVHKIKVQDRQDIKHDTQDIRQVRDNEKIHKITTDKTVKEVVERKTSDQTTYQTDYTQRKISTDWSPTHQAWASTLRGDTPTSTRPSTRASSPGGKTFRSSTSSLRSSVSPDKTSRKPPSRGGSPNKIDRFSPTRNSTDRYSSTHTTHSVTETKTNRYTSPERKYPSSNRPNYSPDRQKPQDHHRPSKSPEKMPQDFTRKPSASPERKPGYTSSPSDNYPRTVSPSRPFDRTRTPSKSSPSPERKPGYLPSDVKPTSDSSAPRNVSPYRASVSPSKETVDERPKASTPRVTESPTRKTLPQQPEDGHPGTTYPRTTSPSRPIYPKDDNLKRPSVSPERKPGYQPSDVRPSLDQTQLRTTSPYRSSASPEKQPTQGHPRDSSPSKPSLNATKEPEYKSPKDTSSDSFPEDKPLRQSISPARKPGYDEPSTPIRPTPVKSPKEASPTPFILKKEPTDESVREPSQKRPSVSPDRKPGYMKPTSSTKPNSESPKIAPTRSSTSPDKKSPVRQAPSQSPDRKPSYTKNTSEIREDHYKFIDEETKMYSRPDKKETDFIQSRPSISPDRYKRPQEKYSSPRQTPGRESPDFCRPQSPTSTRTTLRKSSRSPSPPKEVTFTEDTVKTTKHDHINRTEKNTSTITDMTTKYDKNTEDVTKQYRTPKDKSPAKENPDREPSPTKYDTYDKKQRRTQEEITTTSKKDTEDIKYDSLTRRAKSPQKVPDLPLSPTKKSKPRDSVSPQKSPTKETKYKSTTDFISTEKTTEEIHKKTGTKDHPRKLVTPSTSPTRKPVETAPSTGQSSPTTSVSGFVYFSSPQPVKSIVTDLDDQAYEIVSTTTEEMSTTYRRPENLPVDKSPTPSKIPCRSPSPEKRPAPTKESLPRKSSLKKPTPSDISQVSPTEKPPSSFLVSPSAESRDFPEHKVVKKDHPGMPSSESPIKPKPPLERRETYEERCRKILGMVDDNTTTTTTESTTTTYLQEPRSNASSPSVSPCPSPIPKESSPVREKVCTKKPVDSKVHVTDFIVREREDVVKTSVDSHDHTTFPNKKSKTPSRDSSPTKLQDIITERKIDTESTITSTTEDTRTDTAVKTFKDRYPSPRQSPERKPAYETFVDKPNTDVNQPHVVPTKQSSHVKKSPQVPDDDYKKPSQTFDKKPDYQQPTKTRPTSDHRRTPSPSKSFPTKQNLPSERQPGYKQPVSPTKTSPEKTPKDTKITEQTKPRLSTSPDRKPSYMKPTAVTSTKTTSTVRDMSSKYDLSTKEETLTTEEMSTFSRSSDSPSRDTAPTDHLPKTSLKKQPELKHDREPSPVKTFKVTDETVEFITSEREQEVLERVQKSLRQLSPNRNEKSPSREKSPGKTTTSLHDLDITNERTTINVTTNNIEKLTDEHIISEQDVRGPTKVKDEKTPSKPPSRTTSPTKKTSGMPSPVKGTTHPDKTPDSLTKSRSISPKKPVSPTERPQSPQVPKASGIKPREQIPSHLTRKPTSGPTSPVKTEKIITSDSKKADTSRQTVTKTSTIKTTTSRLVPSPTRTPKTREPDHAPKTLNKENVSPKKDAETKVTRTTSDITIKTKKASPQRIKSKPEIQVNDVSTKTIRQSTVTKTSKSTLKEPQKLPNKPKSATALNTSFDEDDIIVDVQQAKSSRENSPDRICPTPVGFEEDVGTPRYPDQVSEPDDEFRRRTHHTIHEAESIVDDIVEICEDDELFVKKTETTNDSDTDKYLFSVTDKVSKFSNRIDPAPTPSQPKDTTALFKDTERKVHSDFIDDNLKSDECLLSVSEKVNKFAKGPRDTKDRSPSRRIVDEYDRDTVYQDDYTKLSVNDKAHLFIETAENVKAPKSKPAQKVERPDLSNVDDSLKSDDCLLSVSDKVNKFVKTAEQFLTENQEVEEKEKKIKEQHDKIMRQIVDDTDDETYEIISEQKTVIRDDVDRKDTKMPDRRESKPTPSTKDTITSQTKTKEHVRPSERAPTVKITTLRSSEAVKKAKALFENIASTTQKVKDTTISKTTKLTDIGVTQKTPKTDTIIVRQPSTEDTHSGIPDEDYEVNVTPRDSHPPKPLDSTPARLHPQGHDEKPRRSPMRLVTPEVSRTKSPMRHVEITTTTTKTVLTKHPSVPRSESPKQLRPESDKHDKPQDKIPGYLRPTKTSQIKEETKLVEESEVSSRRGSGKFGVELRRTSVERSTASSERRRNSVEHHQPCIEDIFDLDLLEQMLEKVVGYEQRRRIRAQIRVAKKKVESEHTTDSTTFTRTTKQTTITATKDRSPERKPHTRSPDRKSTQHKTTSPERHPKPVPAKTGPERTQPREHIVPVINGHSKEPIKQISEKRQRPQSPEKPAPKSALATRSPIRQPSPDKKTRTHSPTKTPTKPAKTNRFNEYASAYMKKVGLNETDKTKYADTKSKKITEIEDRRRVKQVEEHKSTETKSTTSTSRSFTERTSSKDTIEIVHMNGKRSPSPEKRYSPERVHIERKAPSPDRKAPSVERDGQSPERKAQSPERRAQIHERNAQSPGPRTISPDRKVHSPVRRVDSPERKAQSPARRAQSPTRKAQSPERIVRSPTPEVKRPKADVTKKETIIKTVYDIEKKIPQKQVQEEKPSWVTNRNLKKITSETRTFSSKKLESEKPKYRATSPSKVISKPIDVITSSYGPGPLDADGRPLFGIKALRNGASNYQVKGTVIRQEFHSRNGSEPEGTVSVTAYSSEPEELEKLLQAQGERPSRLHGLAAITTTKRFGGDTGTTLQEAHSKEERATLDQFTHSDRRVTDSSRIESVIDRSDLSSEISRSITDHGSEKASTIESRREEKMIGSKGVDRREDKSRIQRTEEKKERSEKSERRVEERKNVRQSSVKSLTEKYIKSASDTSKTERSAYPKAGLILRTATMKDSVSSDSSAHAGLARTDSEHSLGSVEDTVVTTTTETIGDGGRRTTTTTTTRTGGQTYRTQEKSFLDSSTKVTGVQDILTRMKNADIVIQEGDSTEDSEARALLNKFLGATVLMAGMQSYVTDKPGGIVVKQETVRSSSGGGSKVTSTINYQDIDIDQCWDERVLRKLLDECTDYEQRRRLRARIRTLMAEQEACASAVTEALAAAGETVEGEVESSDNVREEEEVTTVTSSVRRNSSEKTVSSSTTTKTSKVIESMSRPAPKPVSPFAKFRQLEKQNSTNSPNSPKTPQSPGSPSQPYFKFTDPALQTSALTIKERLLQWCRDKTRDYENVKLENFSTSWADGLAFCALVHHFLPDAFDYSKLTPDKRRHNFTLAFKVADEKAGIYPLLDVDDMVAMRKPDWKCVFTYVQSIHRRFKDQN